MTNEKRLFFMGFVLHEIVASSLILCTSLKGRLVFVIVTSLLVALLIVATIERIIVRRLGLELRFSFRRNPLAKQGVGWMIALFIAGAWIPGRLRGATSWDVFVCVAVTYCWVVAFFGFLRYFKEER